MLKAGEVDVDARGALGADRGAQGVANVDMRLEPSTTIYMVLLNSKREPFSNLKARQAAAMPLTTRR